jgi:hypothetical protein
MKSEFSPNSFEIFFSSMNARILALKRSLSKEQLEVYEAELAKLKELFIKDKNYTPQELEEIDGLFL